jgi:Sulfotransferase family
MNAQADAPATAPTVPHFVGIGAPRCGTTWIFKMLRLHPQVWMPWKEIHYFDSVDAETLSGYDIRDRRFRFRSGWRAGLLRLAVGGVPGAGALLRRSFPLRAIQAPGYDWIRRYFLGDASLDWYVGLFREGERAGLRCGEITPAYCMLSPRAIEGFATALPQARAFLMLRNPLDWAWSDLCKRLLASGRQPGALSDAELIAALAVPTGRSRADFGSNLSRWTQHFPRERLFVGLYEDIRGQPEAFFDRLCRFVGVDPYPGAMRHLLTERVNSSARGTPMPPAVRHHAAARYRAETEMMASLVEGATRKWLAEIDRILA